MQSDQANKIYDLIIQEFPHCTVKKEYSVKYKGQQLFFDYYLKDYRILFEIQGRQHSEYVKHFHRDKRGFIKSKKRDNLKIAYCDENNLTLITINYDEKIDTKDDLLKKIDEAL